MEHKVNDTVWVKKHIVEVDGDSLFGRFPYRIDADRWPFVDEVKGLDELQEHKRVKVPLWFANWVMAIVSDGESLITIIAKILQQGCGHSFAESAEYSNSDHTEYEFITHERVRYVYHHKFDLIDAVINGYEIIDQVFEIPLPDLQTSDGAQQYLSYNRENSSYFASRKNAELQQSYTNAELEQVPIIYQKYAVAVEV